MRPNDTNHDAGKEHSLGRNHRPQQAGSVTRRRLLAAGAAGIASLGVLGSVGSAAAATGKHTLTIEGFADNYLSGTNYSFTVEKNLEKSTADGGTISSSDTIINQSAHGTVVGGKDAYTFDGDLVAFAFDRVSRGNPSINVLLDGEPAHVGQRPDHLLEIQGTGSSTTYTFSVNENLRKNAAHGASIDCGDQIINNHRTATGQVSSGTDAYTFDYPYLENTILAFNFDGSPINVLVDGQPAHVGQDFDHLLQIQGTGSLASYSFTVSDQLAETKSAGGSFDSGSGDQLNPRSASGGVTDGADVFIFDGDLRSFDLDGKANVLLDGQPAHVGRRPDHV